MSEKFALPDSPPLQKTLAQRCIYFGSECKIKGRLRHNIFVIEELNKIGDLNNLDQLEDLKKNKDKKNLFAYRLILPFLDNSFLSLPIERELIDLFSVHFQARFYITHRQIEKEGHIMMGPYIEKFPYHPCEKNLCSTIFDDRERIFDDKLKDWIDEIQLNPGKQQKFINASFRYSKALRYVGLDTELVFLHLVSSIEALCEQENSILKGLDFKGVINEGKLTREQVKELERLLNCRSGKIHPYNQKRESFIKFIENYGKSSPHEKEDALSLKLKSIDPDTLGLIYNARSKFLHEGQYMFSEYDEGRILEEYQDYTLLYRGSDKDRKPFPVPSAFESLVRECLLNWVPLQK